MSEEIQICRLRYYNISSLKVCFKDFLSNICLNVRLKKYIYFFCKDFLTSKLIMCRLALIKFTISYFCLVITQKFSKMSYDVYTSTMTTYTSQTMSINRIRNENENLPRNVFRTTEASLHHDLAVLQKLTCTNFLM